MLLAAVERNETHARSFVCSRGRSIAARGGRRCSIARAPWPSLAGEMELVCSYASAARQEVHRPSLAREGARPSPPPLLDTLKTQLLAVHSWSISLLVAIIGGPHLLATLSCLPAACLSSSLRVVVTTWKHDLLGFRWPHELLVVVGVAASSVMGGLWWFAVLLVVMKQAAAGGSPSPRLVVDAGVWRLVRWFDGWQRLSMVVGEGG
ncbi:hypothetical protein Dimus_030156 [Dionaea muscipula]